MQICHTFVNSAYISNICIFTDLSADLDPPLETDVLKHARALAKRAETTDNTPVVLEEYILESGYAEARPPGAPPGAPGGGQKIYHTRLTIYQVRRSLFHLINTYMMV